MLDVFETNISRRIFRPTQEEEGWWIRCAAEICGLYKATKVTEFVKFRRLQWAVNVIRMAEQRMSKKDLQPTIHCKRRIGKRETMRRRTERECGNVICHTSLENQSQRQRILEATHRGGQGSIWAVTPLQQRQ
jgi:hypothetical protein